MHERLDRGEEARDDDTGEHERRGVPFPAGGAADRPRDDDCGGPAQERGDREELLSRQRAREIRDRERGAETSAGCDAEEIGIGERVVEDALVSRARDGEHAAHERGEHDPGDSELPEDRLLRCVERRRVHQPESSEDRADGIADTDVERSREDPEDDRDDEEAGRRQRPRG